MIKISYIPFSKKKINPGYDLRNVLLYSRLRKIAIEEYIANDEKEIIIIPPSYDPTDLSIFKNKNKKIIYQLVDDYLSVNIFSFKNIFRGFINFLLGRGKKITFNYKKSRHLNLKKIKNLLHL